jgi:hypothetical protein
MKRQVTKTYYHISPIENKDSILIEGLKSEQKEIFVSDCEEQLIHIAHSQIFTLEYSVFEILPSGINGNIEWDNVAEMGAKHQFIIEQNLISPEHIRHLRDEKWNRFDLAEYTYRKSNLYYRGHEAESELEELISCCDKEWCDHYNLKYGKKIQFKESLI